jgi:hypothetical protein
VEDFFNPSRAYAGLLARKKIKLIPRAYGALANCWPDTMDFPWPASTRATITNIDDLLQYTFLNAAGSTFDGMEFMQVESFDQIILVAYQNTYSIAGATNFTQAMLKAELTKITQLRTTVIAHKKRAAIPNFRVLSKLWKTMIILPVIYKQNCRCSQHRRIGSYPPGRLS